MISCLWDSIWTQEQGIAEGGGGAPHPGARAYGDNKMKIVNLKIIIFCAELILNLIKPNKKESQVIVIF